MAITDSDPSAASTGAVSLPVAEERFLASLIGRSPRTAATYRTALGRLHEYLESTGVDPAAWTTTQVRGDLLERLYLWLTRVYGRDDRFTVATYVAGARAFLRFCARRHLLLAWCQGNLITERTHNGAVHIPSG